MNIRRILSLLRKDLALGPRSPVLLFAIAIPLALTLVSQLALGDIAERKPSVGIAEPAATGFYDRLAARGDFSVFAYPDASALRHAVESGWVDTGIALGPDFLQGLRAGATPPLEFVAFPGSQVLDRASILVAAFAELRALKGEADPFTMEVVRPAGAGEVDLAERLIPIMAMFAFLIAGLFAPASSLVEEKERRTLSALLIAPTRLAEILASKAIMGIIAGTSICLITLALNGALARNQAAIVVAVLVSSVFWSMLGLLIGLVARTGEALFAIVKGSGLLFFAPLVFYFFPEWPQWIARIFPTFWAIDPLWRAFSEGAHLDAIALELCVVALISLAFLPILGFLGKRMKEKLVA